MNVKVLTAFSGHGQTMFKVRTGIRLAWGALVFTGAAVVAWLTFGWATPPVASGSAAAAVAAAAAPWVGEPISPVPVRMALDERKVALGERLFSDPRLSANGSVSCASCHHLENGGVDHLARSRGVDGREGTANAPSVFNSGLNFRQFWDGRARTLEDQIDGPLQNPLEMANTWPNALRAIAADPQYRASFKSVYEEGISVQSVKDALATFERSLITPHSPFDRYLRGEVAAITPAQLEGYRLFKAIGCASCHQGVNVGGNMYQKLGIMDDYFVAERTSGTADLGRFNVTGREEDRYHFRVPPLRNVALTAPYLHNGSVPTLDDTIRLMARYQLGKDLSDDQVQLISGFLHTLTGEYRGQRLQ